MWRRAQRRRERGWQELGWEGSVTREGGDISDPLHLGLREAPSMHNAT